MRRPQLVCFARMEPPGRATIFHVATHRIKILPECSSSSSSRTLRIFSMVATEEFSRVGRRERIEGRGLGEGPYIF
jgi:hypothetical protein